MTDKKKFICPYCGKKEMVYIEAGGNCLICKKKTYSAKYIKAHGLPAK